METIIILKRLSLSMILICLHPKSGHSLLITLPRDTEVLISQSTYLNCSTSILSEQIHWYHYRVGENQTNYVYYKGQFNQIYADRYSIEINIETGEYNLIIRSVQTGDAGRYVCQDDGGLGDLGSAELIVLESTPACLFSMKPDGFVGPNSCDLPLDKLQLSCSVLYNGNIPPVLQWKIEGNDAPILKGITFDYSGQRTTVNLTMSSTVDMDGIFFTCGATRSHDKKLSCTTDPAKINLIKREICVWETFNAECPHGTVIFIQRALYGRMHSSRCIGSENMGLDCYANVQLYLERQCNGRSECSVRGSDQQLTSVEGSCPKHQKPYLEAEYTCTHGFSCSPFKPPEGANIFRTSNGYQVTCPNATNTKDLLCRDGSWSKDPKKICTTNDDPRIYITMGIMIIVPCATVTLIILVTTVTVFIHKHRQRNQHQESSSYVDIYAVQPMTSTRYGQDSPPIGISEPAVYSTIQHRSLPTDQHIYAELQHEVDRNTSP